MNILSKDILPLKTSQKFSSVLEPYAVKVASTVLRGGCHCEVMFLPDYILVFQIQVQLLLFLVLKISQIVLMLQRYEIKLAFKYIFRIILLIIS